MNEIQKYNDDYVESEWLRVKTKLDSKIMFLNDYPVSESSADEGHYVKKWMLNKFINLFLQFIYELTYMFYGKNFLDY